MPGVVPTLCRPAERQAVEACVYQVAEVLSQDAVVSLLDLKQVISLMVDHLRRLTPSRTLLGEEV